MAQYVPVPKDLAEVKQKFMFNLTKRQCLCFGLGFVVGIPLYLLLYKAAGMGMTSSLVVAAIAASPAFMCGLYQKNGLFFEKYVRLMFLFFRSPRKRTYKSENTYVQIAREVEYHRLYLKLHRGETPARKKGGSATNAKR